MLIACFGRDRVAAQSRPPDCDSAAAAAETMLARTNEARGTLGLPPYRVNDTLTRIAFEHARDMAAHGYYSHTGRDGRKEDARARDAGYGAGRQQVRVDEVFVARKDLDEAFQWLMSDPDHRPLMVHRDLVEVGSGAACTSYGHLWVLDFGSYQGVDDPTPVPPTATPEPPTATMEPTATPTAAATETSVPTQTAAVVEAPAAAATASPGAAAGRSDAAVGTAAGATAAPGDGGTTGPGGASTGWGWWGIGLVALLALGVAGIVLKRGTRRRGLG